MKGYIICTGTELLLGKTLNTNSQYICDEFAKLGIDVFKVVTVGDNLERIKAAIAEADEDVDIVFLNGGLGPTEDDVTREALVSYLDIEETIDSKIKHRIEKQTSYQVLPGDLKVAMIPKGSKVFYSEAGVAPGTLIESKNKKYFLTPGPPNELKYLMEKELIPYIKKELLADEVIFSKTLKFAGIGESKAEDKIKDLIKSTNPTIAPTIKEGEIHFRITAKGQKKEEAKRLVDEYSHEVLKRLDNYYFGRDEETIEGLVAQALDSKKLKVAVAESCTGGLLANTLTNIPGSSNFFDRGYITYSYEAKKEDLGVKESTLLQYGAVSENTAIEMVEGVYAKTKADFTISITGIAGPGGGTIDKPVGLVYMGFKYSDKVDVATRTFTGDRLMIKSKIVKFILFEMYKRLKEK